MIRIEKPTEPPPILRSKGAEATQAHCDEFDLSPDDYREAKRNFKFAAKLYGAKSVKKALIKAQHGKCAFCESAFAHVAYGDVEHFRPKGGYKQTAKGPLGRPGYYWLAYEWANLYVACQICNQSHKKNLFPLVDPERRAKTHRRRIEEEQPLLIDCGVEDPERFIQFREEYAFAVDGNKRGKASIDILRLNHEALVESRRDRLKSIVLLMHTISLLIARIHEVDASSVQKIEELRVNLRCYQEDLQRMVHQSSEYASMARSAING